MQAVCVVGLGLLHAIGFVLAVVGDVFGEFEGDPVAEDVRGWRVMGGREGVGGGDGGAGADHGNYIYCKAIYIAIINSTKDVKRNDRPDRQIHPQPDQNHNKILDLSHW
jgi:hypothetical protein